MFADLTPLRVSAPYRRLWWGLGLANFGAQLTVMAVGLQVYALTGSTLAVGGLGLAALIPLLVMGLYGGALADAYDRRRLALIASTIMWTATIGIALHAWSGGGHVWPLFALTAVQSGAQAVNSAARSAIIPRLVGVHLLPAANALSQVTNTLAMMLGPVVGAFLVGSVGYAWTYTVDVVTFTAALYAIFRLPAIPPLRPPAAGRRRPAVTDPERPVLADPEPVPSASEPNTPASESGTPSAEAPAATPVGGWRSVGEGLVFLATRRNLLMTFAIDLCAMVLAFPRAAFPAVAVWVIGGGETTAGILTAAIAAGAAIASILSGPVGRVRRQGWVAAWAVTAWGGAIAMFGVVVVIAGPTKPPAVVWWALILACVALALAGAADAVSAVMRGTILQSATPDHLRGRLQGVFVVVVTGGPRLGDMVTGADSAIVGEGWAVVIGGLACIAGVWLLMRWQRGFARYDALHPIP
ncbi:MAG: MFS transporter [Bifidobacteriaceae bacterium]|jgi:MFS family permease|nr:MFS transporter [Bifidobacteriaceae bacterium]